MRLSWTVPDLDIIGSVGIFVYVKYNCDPDDAQFPCMTIPRYSFQ